MSKNGLMRATHFWFKRTVIALMAFGAIGTTAVMGRDAVSGVISFLSAPAGVPIPFAAVPLPVAKQPPLFPPNPGVCPFTPTYDELVSTGIVITNEARMKQVWRILFSVPYDASLFDFANSFVIMKGDGVMQNSSTFVSSVEQVTPNYACVFFCDGQEDPFLVMSTQVFIGGAPPPDPPPPPNVLISAVRVDWAYHDDVVFHRDVIFAP